MGRNVRWGSDEDEMRSHRMGGGRDRSEGLLVRAAPHQHRRAQHWQRRSTQHASGAGDHRLEHLRRHHTTGLPALLRTTASSVTTASPSRHRRGRPHHRVKPACAITPRHGTTHHRTRNRPLTVPMRPTPPAYATRSTAAMCVAQPRHTPPPRGLVARGAQRWGGGRCSYRHLEIMIFCSRKTRSGGISIPRSPRATITPSVTSRISSNCHPVAHRRAREPRLVSAARHSASCRTRDTTRVRAARIHALTARRAARSALVRGARLVEALLVFDLRDDLDVLPRGSTAPYHTHGNTTQAGT